MIDGALVGASIHRSVRFLVYGPHFRLRGLHWLLRQLHAIPVTAGNRREVVQAIEHARAELAAGHVVCIFAEGAVSRTGNLLPFKRGFERIVDGLDVPDRPGLPRSRLGQHLQLQGRQVLLEVAGAAALPGDGRFGAPLPPDRPPPKPAGRHGAGREASRDRRGRAGPAAHGVHPIAKRRWRRSAIADSRART